MVVPNDIFEPLNRAIFISLIDFFKAYWLISVCMQCSKHCTYI